MSYMPAGKKQSIRFGEDGDSLLMLIIINVVVFIILMFIKIVYQLTPIPLEQFKTHVMDWVTLPANLQILITRPWVILTHMFSQIDVWNMIGNMIFLWAFGFLLQDLLGNRHVAPVYIYGCFAGAFLFVLSVNFFPQFRESTTALTYTGASTGVMAVAIAATVTAPNYRVFPMISGGIPIWIITLIYVIIDFAGLASFSFPYNLAHLGGALMGFFYIKLLRNEFDLGVWMHSFYSWFFNLFNPIKSNKGNLKRKEVFYNTKGQPPFSKKSNITQQRVDDILDKISQQGYQSLTQEEKDILKKAANNETL